MNISEVSKQIHDNAKAKGFWDKERNVGELLMLITSELGEALEAHRKNIRFDAHDKRVLQSTEGLAFKINYQELAKETFEAELADVAIRLFDLCEGMNVDLVYHIEQKMKYNGMRERLHGKAY